MIFYRACADLTVDGDLWCGRHSGVLDVGHEQPPRCWCNQALDRFSDAASRKIWSSIVALCTSKTGFSVLWCACAVAPNLWSVHLISSSTLNHTGIASFSVFFRWTCINPSTRTKWKVLKKKKKRHQSFFYVRFDSLNCLLEYLLWFLPNNTKQYFVVKVFNKNKTHIFY